MPSATSIPKQNASKSAAYFISDAHLGNNAGSALREQHLVQFLAQIQSDAECLFIVGDLFDFWIEYQHAIRPDYFNILCALKNLRDSGTQIHYLAGNHDFALGPFLQHQIGMQLHLKHYTPVLQHRRFFISHGNGLLPGQRADRFVQRQLANLRWQKLYRLLHPSLGVPLGNAVSRLSRRHNQQDAQRQWAGKYRRMARTCLQHDYDCLVFGHTHWPEIHHWHISGRPKVYCNTGEWMDRYTYARLCNGHLRLWEYRPHQPSLEIIPRP